MVSSQPIMCFLCSESEVADIETINRRLEIDLEILANINFLMSHPSATSTTNTECGQLAESTIQRMNEVLRCHRKNHS
jgi:hypothetical protein